MNRGQVEDVSVKVRKNLLVVGDAWQAAIFVLEIERCGLEKKSIFVSMKLVIYSLFLDLSGL
jgi:hypothetical protein